MNNVTILPGPNDLKIIGNFSQLDDQLDVVELCLVKAGLQVLDATLKVVLLQTPLLNRRTCFHRSNQRK
jgi:hypothetical protein